jgi:signal peptidase II
MNAKKILRTLAILMILGSNISCDQITKNMVRKSIDDHEQIGLLHNYFTLMKVENTGAFLSLGASLPQPIKILLLTVLPIILLSLSVVYLMIKTDLSRLNILGICFVVGGGAGNIFDRAMYGSVTDFMHIDFGLFQTGIFNMADVSVLTGMLMILTEAWLTRQKSDPKTIHRQ